MTSRSEMSIFLEALDHERPEDREALLARACGSRADPRGAAEGPPPAHASPGHLLDVPIGGVRELAASAEAAMGNGGARAAIWEDEPGVLERPGSIVGDYKLLEKIGEGGFALVFV